MFKGEIMPREILVPTNVLYAVFAASIQQASVFQARILIARFNQIETPD